MHEEYSKTNHKCYRFDTLRKIKNLHGTDLCTVELLKTPITEPYKKTIRKLNK